MNPAIKRHFELEIKTLLQNAARDADDKLERLLEVKERHKEEAMHTLKTRTFEAPLFFFYEESH